MSHVTSESALSRADRLIWILLVGLWIAANLIFWSWWLQPARVGVGWMYALFTLAWAYEATFLPSMYLFFVGRMRRPCATPAPDGVTVALITLCLPSQETIDVIEAQLEALVAVTYPHDSWVLDEGNDYRVRQAAERLGLRYFTRKGVDRYNQSGPPFAAKTKAGNVNAWLDACGLAYDIFVQFDVDHRPAPHYLHRVLGYFQDERVAWVQPPSLYGNLSTWVARGAAEQELVLQGPLQRGFFGHSGTPFIIGSHCTYRTRAIAEIGGFQPTRAEDHLDTAMLAAHGYRGVFVPEVLAIGNGPETFETYLRQQFAWARSMMQVLLGFTPRLLWAFRPGQAVQFVFAQTWYPLWSSSMLALYLVPLLALLTGSEPAHASLPQIVLMAAPLTLCAFAAWRWTRRWQMPRDVDLTWRGIVLHIARWPIVFWALVNVLLRVRHPYMVTPKGDHGGLPASPLRTLAIYLVTALLSLACVWRYILGDEDDTVQGYAPFVLLGVAYMLLVVLANICTDLRELRRRGLGVRRIALLRATPLVLALGMLGGLGCTASATRQALVTVATWNSAAAPGATDTPGASAALHALEQTTPRRLPGVLAGDLMLALDGRPAKRTNPSNLTALEAPGSLLIGAYDPWQDARHLSLGIEHWYIRQDDPELLEAALEHAGDRVPLVTLEPFPRRGSMPVLDRVAAGRTDAQLRRLASVFRAYAPRVVLVRWGHEMDLSGLYPWSANDPERFRAAFRHVVETFRAEGVTTVRWVWSPAGEPGASAYYPGADVVDYVGLTVLGDADWDFDFGYLNQRSMTDLLRPRYAEVARFRKPIVIAELGVSGDEATRLNWLADGFAHLHEFDLIRAAVYSNDRNAPNNRRAVQPDWRLPHSTLEWLSLAHRSDTLSWYERLDRDF